MRILENPVSRLFSLGLLTLLLNKLAWFGLLAFMLPLVYLFYHFPKPAKQVLYLAKRLRWFYLSIFILYFFFYPGTELIALMGKYSPSQEGVNEAGLRIASLFIIISYSVFLLNLTPRGEIISAIQYILTPLKYLGVDSNRFALRLGLVLAYVPEMAAEKKQSDRKKRKNYSEIIDQFAVMVKQADEMKSVNIADELIVIKLKRAGLIDILIPLLLLFWLLSIT